MHAVTDVTGFGLSGHGWEMAERSDCSWSSTPTACRSTPARWRRPSGACAPVAIARNREYLGERVRRATAAEALEALCFDPQTSGGLLAAVTAGASRRCEAAGFTAIGRVESGPRRESASPERGRG